MACDGCAADCGVVAVDPQPERRGVALGLKAQRQLALTVLDVVRDDGHVGSGEVSKGRRPELRSASALPTEMIERLIAEYLRAQRRRS
jgi:hypothetical protein